MQHMTNVLIFLYDLKDGKKDIYVPISHSDIMEFKPEL